MFCINSVVLFTFIMVHLYTAKFYDYLVCDKLLKTTTTWIQTLASTFYCALCPSLKLRGVCLPYCAFYSNVYCIMLNTSAAIEYAHGFLVENNVYSCMYSTQNVMQNSGIQ